MDPTTPGCVLNRQTLLGILKCERPPAFTISDIYHALKNPMADLDEFANARVNDITRYNRSGIIDHDYLILCILYQGESTTYQVWARCERRPDPVNPHVQTQTWDSVSFSFELDRVHHKCDPIEQLQLADVKVKHIAHLLNLVQENARIYHAFSFNCWWFADVVLRTLEHHHHKSDRTFPKRMIIKRALVSALKGWHTATAEVSQHIRDQFHKTLHGIVDGVDGIGSVQGSHQDESTQPPSHHLRSEGNNSQSTLPNPQGEPEQIEKHGRGVDAPGAEHTQKQGSEQSMSSQRTKPLATPTLDRVQFKEIVQRVIEKQNKDDYQLLAIIYPSMITAHGLLRALESLFEQAHQQSETRVGKGVLDFMQEWVLSGQLDDSLLLEMEDFISGQSSSTHSLDPQMSCVKSLISHRLSSSQSPSAFSYRSISPQPSLSTMSSGGKAPRKHEKVLKELASMGDSDIRRLSRALCNLELENYAKLTLPSAVKILTTWRDDQDASRPQLFPLFSEKLRAWVIEECLHESLRHRQHAFKAFYMIAKECREHKNLASLNTIIQALRSTYISGLHHISDDVPDLSDLATPLSPAEAPMVPELNDFLQSRLPTFISIRNQTGEVSWQECCSLYLELKNRMAPSNAPHLDVRGNYHEYVEEAMANALDKRHTHSSRSERLSKIRFGSLGTEFQAALF